MLNLPRSANARALGDAVVTGYGTRLFRALHPSDRSAGA